MHAVHLEAVAIINAIHEQLEAIENAHAEQQALRTQSGEARHDGL